MKRARVDWTGRKDKRLSTTLTTVANMPPEEGREVETQADDIEDIYELSPMQQGMLFHTLYSPKSGTYIEQSVFAIEGAFDVSALERAWQRIVERHTILRTSFLWEDLEKPLQVVHRRVSLRLEQHDWRALSSEAQQQRLRSFLETDRGRGFELGIAPLMRLMLIRVAENACKLVWSRHHLLLDRWSRSLLIKELFALYDAFSKGEELQLTESRPFGDYIAWLLDQNLPDAEAFWRRSLKGVTAPTSLGVDRVAINQLHQEESYDDQRIQISEAATSALKSLARQNKLTLNTIVQGAWALLLSRYSGEEDVVFGATVSGRPPELAGVESMVGLLVNTLPVRVEAPTEAPLVPWLKRLHGQQVELRQYEYSSLMDIQGWSEVARGLPLFDSILVFENIPVGNAFRGVSSTAQIRSEGGVGARTGYPLVVLVSPGSGLSVQAVYDCRRFDSASIGRLLGHFNSLLEGFAANPERRLSDFLLLTEGERNRLLVEYNDTASDYPRGCCIHQMFEAQVEKDPDAVALVSGDERLTYGELNARANQLASHLRRRGVGPEALVAVCMSRSLNLVTALLGVLKAGAAYVPLDVKYPKERLSFMLEDTQAPALLTETALVEDLPEYGGEVVRLDADWEDIAQESGRNLIPDVSSENLAYVIYTSGSTGGPKGVAIEHRSAIALLNWAGDAFSEDQLAGVLASTSVCFDLSIFELFVPLSAGGTVILAQDVLHLPGLRAAKCVTLINTVPSAMAELIRVQGVPSSVLTVNLAGEPLQTSLVHQIYGQCNVKQVFDLYGPSEDTTYSTFALRSADGPATIGRPITNTRVYILDGHLDPVPVGVAGELYIGGEGLARGYLGRPEFTAERFIPDRFGTKPGARLYRTGDLARYLHDGNIEFLGRIDNQVKVRGFRIELGEIESVISGHPAVRESVVIAREDEPGDKRLVAYVVANSQANDSTQGKAFEWQAERVSQWQSVWDQTYAQAVADDDPTFNITGWNSSYTGQPISKEEMREWADHAVDRILSERPGRILEIGCGTGLLMFRIAPSCDEYWATDASTAALHYVELQLSRAGQKPGQINLLHKTADDFDGIEQGAFDLVILNSVIQYFPCIDYLVRVLEGAVKAVKPGGCIFIGDVRSLPLLETLHTSANLHQAEPDMPVAELRRKVQSSVSQEKELAVAPAFFEALKRRIPRISGVELQLKRGRHHNEITRFRYDITLRVEGPPRHNAEHLSLDWRDQALTLADVRALLGESEPDCLVITQVPNARLVAEVKAVELLKSGHQLETVGELRDALKSIESGVGVEPEDFWALREGLPYEVEVRWSGSGEDGCFTALFRRVGSEPAVPRIVEDPASALNNLDQPLARYANNPLHAAVTNNLLPQLRNLLKQTLPDYMLPSDFVLLDELPLTPNGKVNRRALPRPEKSRIKSEGAFVSARTPIEELVTGIWARVLGMEQIGVYDNFFALGGHSLKATQVVSRVYEALKVELPLRSLFESPTIAELAVRIEAAIRADDGLPTPQVIPVSRGTQIPSSFAQQRLWFLDRLEPGSCSYNVSQAIRMEGGLDRHALEQALNEIVRRHESLRTTFAATDGAPVQVIAECGVVTMPVVGLGGSPKAEREAEALRLAVEEMRRPFDLVGGPLLRARLLRLDEQEHMLLLVMHHIVSDGWSLGLFVRELTILYDAFSRGEPSPLPELSIQYADYAAWQRQWLQGEVLEKQLAYWRNQLAGVPGALNLPTDRLRPTMHGFRGAKRSLTLPKSLTEKLKALSDQEGVTLFMTLLAAFQTMLMRYTEEEDIVVGSPIANRNRAEIEGLIGFFANTLVLRTDLSGSPSFRELLTRAREVALGAYAHQDVPFEKLVEELQPERSLSRTPLFQVMFAMQNTPRQVVDLSGLKLLTIGIDNKTAKFDLTLFVSERTDGLACWMEYNTDLYEEATIRRMLGHFEVLLGAIVADSQTPIARLMLLTEAERDQLLSQGNLSHPQLPRFNCVQLMFEEQALRTPEAIAVVFGNQHITYKELNARANQLAHYLKAFNVGPDTKAGICIERSVELVIGVLGILKAVGAYVPLDPAYPHERLSFMMGDAELSVLLTQQSLRNRLPVVQVPTLCLDTDWEVVAKESEENPESQVEEGNLAYIIYTSGSTGNPKGVAMTHGPLANLIAWQMGRSTLSATAKTLQYASISFDVSFQDIFSTWCSGGTLVMVSEELRRDAPALLRLMADESIERLFVPFVTLQQLAEAARKGAIPERLREISTAGEQLEMTPQIASLLKGLRDCALYNQYGPSESHVVTEFGLAGSIDDMPVLPPIGRPIPSARIYLLDRNLQPVPIGVPGELYIGGDVLARGYINRPELTAERFIASPFGTHAGDRLYKTGDMARYLCDGDIEFLGRIDNQVKIRGFRVELGEVEATLRLHPDVQDVAVVAKENPSEGKRLVAYIVADSARAQTGQLRLVSGMRAFMKKNLPEYMIPSAFVMLESLPMTPSGKIDRKALPDPGKLHAEAAESLAGPRDPLEAQLIAIWEDLLGVGPVGRSDNFFDLGGHSLLAVRLMDRIEQTYGKKLPLSTLYSGATVEYLGQALLDQEKATLSFPLVPIKATGTKRPFFFLHGDFNGGGFYSLNLARYLDEDQPFYILQPHGLDGRPLPWTIEAMAASHLEVMRRYQPEGPYMLGGYCNGALIAFEMARLLHGQGQKVDLLIVIDASARNARFRPLRALVRCMGGLLRLEPDEQLIWFVRLRDHMLRLRKMSRREQVGYLTEAMREIKEKLASKFAGRNGNVKSQAVASEIDQGRELADGLFRHNDEINLRYGRAVWGYVPQSYAGCVKLFQPSEQPAASTDDPTNGWRKVAAEVDVQMIPGNHLTSITKYGRFVAERLNACLREAQARD